MIGTQDTVLLGRRIHAEWSRHWPTSVMQPFADFNNVRKYVVTSSMPPTGWTNTTVTAGPVADLVAKLKSRPGADIGVDGSIDLTRSMLRDGLVDRLSLVLAPDAVGDRTPAVRRRAVRR